VDRHERQRRFTEWAAEFDGLLWKVARSFASGVDQDDLHQELLLALWQAIPAFRADAKASTFAYRVAHNHALTWNRKRRRREVPIHQAPEHTNAMSSEDAELQIERLYEQIRKLAPLDRTLVLLYLDELSYREMAEILGLTESNVGVRLNRAKKQLAEQMKEVASAGTI
jgi:RNA polymerase sigma factor (sigma-70 family)